MLEDVQNRPDDRRVAIDQVGISGIRYPVVVMDRNQGKQNTIAEVSMSVGLHPEVKGAHLSRFVEVLHDSAAELTPQTLPSVLRVLRSRLNSRSARLQADFLLFLLRPAPVTGAVALMDYACGLTGELDDHGSRLTLSVRVPVTSVCPCSKAISDYGAHNQRSHITITAGIRIGEDSQPALVCAEDLIEIAEAASSCPVFPLLKRPDERHVTMRAYDHPVFVEDMVRSVALALSADQRIESFHVGVSSDESIHNHGAFATIASAPNQPTLTPTTGDGTAGRARGGG